MLEAAVTSVQLVQWLLIGSPNIAQCVITDADNRGVSLVLSHPTMMSCQWQPRESCFDAM